MYPLLLPLARWSSSPVALAYPYPTCHLPLPSPFSGGACSAPGSVAAVWWSLPLVHWNMHSLQHLTPCSFSRPLFQVERVQRQAAEQLRAQQVESQAQVEVYRHKWRVEFDRRRKLHNQVGNVGGKRGSIEEAREKGKG